MRAITVFGEVVGVGAWILGSGGCVCIWISLSGQIFGLSRRDRISAAIFGGTCCGLALWGLDQISSSLQ